ncbi:hypothetical protein C7974DRAFT_414121 [Boeremia exigua]|uniref:uncharacterized protein n=1 Tax=Boeremia exigua TaxID=749465 RepID=UPI001E8E6FA2|nr:uncharacterized protein C7974DRAFT_414121 [Boeremia exigua]KAH6625621.1 hypothetical protein C7974DRAFT_414121 [Boeremia exigua]
MASMAGQLYVIQRSTFPAQTNIRCLFSAVFSEESSALEHAQRMHEACTNFGGESDNRESPYAYTIDLGTSTHRICVHPIRLPDTFPEQEELGWIVATLSWPTHARSLTCPMQWDIRSRFTLEDACETAAVLAYNCTNQSANASSLLVVCHDADGMPHWTGQREGTKFRIDVFDRSFDFGPQMDEMTMGMDAMALCDRSSFWWLS